MLGRTRGTRSAITCAAIAVAGVAGTAAFSESLRALEDDPSTFGVTWSLALGEYGDRETWEAGRDLARRLPGVESTAGFRASIEPIAGVEMLVVDFSDASGEIGPVVTDGRAPTEDDEIALGAAAMDVLGAEIGDELEGFGRHGGRVEVVGEIVANDNGIEAANPSVAALVGRELFDTAVTFGSDAVPQWVLVTLEPDVPLVDAAVALRQHFGQFVQPPLPPTDIRNLRLILPAVVAATAVVVVLAVAALAHSLISTIRLRRRDLATLRALGFTRGQVSGAVAWDATAVAVIAAAVGVPLGLLVAHVTWRSIEDDLGVVSPPQTPLLLVASAAVGGTLVVANLVTVAPGRRAARMRPVEALRAE